MASPVKSDGLPFDAVVVLEHDRLKVHLCGDLDFAALPILDRALAQANMQDVREIAVDLAHLDFLDAAGLRALVSARCSLRAESRNLVLLHASPLATRILDITGLTDLLEDEPSREAMDRWPVLS